MKKTAILLIALILFLVLLLTIVFFNLKKIEKITTNEVNAQEREYDMMWTKAICNESYCQDYEIRCRNNQIVSKTPITGAILVISKDWEDPRDEEFRNKFCE